MLESKVKKFDGRLTMNLLKDLNFKTKRDGSPHKKKIKMRWIN